MEKSDLEQKLRKIFIRFFNEQMGEFPASISIMFWATICTVIAEKALPRAEAQMIQNDTAYEMLKRYKNQQFEKVIPILKKELESAAICEPLNIDFFMGKDNAQYLIINFPKVFYVE
jgi:uncharacterized protein YbcI